MSSGDVPTRSALIFGATGQTGKPLLRELLLSHSFSRVGEYGRRVTPIEELSGIPDIEDKLFQRSIDFEKVNEDPVASELKAGRWDTVFVALGSTRQRTPSDEEWEKVDRSYVLNAAQSAKTDDPTHHQRIIYVSAGGANASSRFLYMRSKGLTENGLASLGYSDTIVFRPGFLANKEGQYRNTTEHMVAIASGCIAHFWSEMQIHVSDLARSMRLAAQIGSNDFPATVQASTARAGPSPNSPPFTVISNKGAVILSTLEPGTNH